MSEPLKVFITYSHRDTDAREELRIRLAVMEQQGMITLWDDNKILPGDEWYKDISDNLADSDILLYLVSASSLASKNCNKELGDALSSEIRVIPIILERCDWQNHQLSDIQALPDKGKPINEWTPESRGWQSVVEGIRKAAEKMRDQPKPLHTKTLAYWALQQGNSLMTLLQIDKAIEAYSHAIQLDPHYANAYSNRGAAYNIKGKLDRAITDYNKTIELDPDHANAYNNRGNAYSDKGKLDRAIADYNKAIALDSDIAEPYNNRGVAYKDKGEFDRAIEDFNKAMQLNPQFVPVHNNRGTAYGGKGEFDRAIEDFNKAIDLKLDYAEAYNNRGNIYSDKGEFDRAIEDFNKAIELNPQFAKAHNNRGDAYSREGELDRAIADYNKAIELNPNIADVYCNRGNIYSDKGELDRAVKDFTEAIGLKPDYAEAYCNRGITYGREGEFDRAIEDFNKAIELNPQFAEAHNNRGVAFAREGEFDRAVKDFTKAIGLKPDYAEAYCNRGIAYSFKGEYDRAITYYNRAIELDPQFALAYTNRGMCWLHLQNWQGARGDLTVAKSMGMDIIAVFRKDYKNVEAFERRNRVQLPEDIADMLTQRRRSRFPKTEKFLNDDGTSLESPDVSDLCTKLRNMGTPLADYVKTRSHFGIKTAPTEAFVVDSAMRDELIAEHPSSADILKPFLHGRGIRRWQVEAQGLWLIFAYRGIEMNSYPAIQKHLEKYRDSLSKRAGKQKWCELQATLGDSKRFTQTKLVCPNLYNHQTFAIETDGFYCGHTCYIIPTEETWLCGVLNSRVVEWFYSQVSNQLTGDELRALSSYMQQIPIPNITSTQKGLIGKIVDYLIYLQRQPTTNSKDLAYARDYIMLRYFERIIDGLVYESYLSEELHQSGKHFFKPLLDEQLLKPEEIQGDKMSAFRDIFEHLYEKTHPIRKNLFFLDSLKPIRIIEGKV